MERIPDSVVNMERILDSAVNVPCPKLSHLFLELMLDFDGISIGCAQGRDVHKFHIGLDVYMQSTAVLEH